MDQDLPVARHRRESIFELLQHERYTLAEAAEVLGLDVHVVEHAAFSGELRAEIVEHQILAIRREDLIAWVLGRDQESATDR
jgi:hypothetical protein